MADYPSEIELDKPAPPEPGAPPARKRLPVVLWAGIGLLVLALAAAYMFLRRSPPNVGAGSPSEKLGARQAEPEEQIILPPLDETDPIVRQLVGRLSSHPAVAAWLTTDGLLLNFVVVTSRIANGETPVVELKAVGPVPRFRAVQSGDMLYVDPASYRRYDRHAEAVSGLDARGTARLYATLKPRISDAYKKLGPSDGNFDPVLERALIEMLEAPIVEGNIALEPHGVVYAFAEPRLQNLSSAQKQLLRMGSHNVRAIQVKLREIATYLGIPESRLPRGSLTR